MRGIGPRRWKEQRWRQTDYPQVCFNQQEQLEHVDRSPFLAMLIWSQSPSNRSYLTHTLPYFCTSRVYLASKRWKPCFEDGERQV
jgi:hypothetical protein